MVLHGNILICFTVLKYYMTSYAIKGHYVAFVYYCIMYALWYHHILLVLIFYFIVLHTLYCIVWNVLYFIVFAKYYLVYCTILLDKIVFLSIVWYCMFRGWADICTAMQCNADICRDNSGGIVSQIESNSARIVFADICIALYCSADIRSTPMHVICMAWYYCIA